MMGNYILEFLQSSLWVVCFNEQSPFINLSVDQNEKERKIKQQMEDQSISIKIFKYYEPSNKIADFQDKDILNSAEPLQDNTMSQAIVIACEK